MQDDTWKLRLTPLFQKVFDNPILELDAGMTAADVKGWDSLTHIHLILAVEKEFDLRFTTREVRTLGNLGVLIHLIEEKQKGKKTSC